MTEDYLARKLSGRCTRPGCKRKASPSVQLCRSHHYAAKAALKRHFERKRLDNRNAGQCAVCGAKSERYRCPTCAVKHAMTRPPSRGANNGENQRSTIASRTSVDKDGRTRFHGQGKRGQQPRSQLDDQDLLTARRAIDKAMAGLSLARSPAMLELPRIQRKDAERAALAVAGQSARFVLEVLERNGCPEFGQLAEDDGD